MSRRSEALHAAAGLSTLALPAIPPCRCFTARPKPADPAIQAGARCSLSWRESAMAQGAGLSDRTTWHAAVTHQDCEKAVQEVLQGRGIDTVLPMIRYWRVRNRRRFVGERPLLPSIILFGMDRSRQSLVDMVETFDYEPEQQRMVSSAKPFRAVPVPGIERIVRGASDAWAVIPTEEVWDLRIAVLRGDFDATLRQSHPQYRLPPIVRWLIDHGELPRESAFTHKQAKHAGLKFSEAA